MNVIFFESPILETYQRQFDAIFTDPRYADLSKNLGYFSDLYKKIKAEKKPVTDYFVPPKKGDLAPWSRNEKSPILTVGPR
jgi:hypothetical protein